MNTTSVRKWYPVAPSGTLPLREGKRVISGPYDIALFNLGDEYRAVDNRCPHQSGPLSEGIVSGKTVFCPLHNWKISLESGCAIAGGKGQIKIYPVKELNGFICIALEEGTLQEQVC